MKHIACITLLGLCALALLSKPLHAAGGIYFDDYSLSNNGQTVFSENFDGPLDRYTGWSIYNGSASTDYSHSGSSSLLLDWHGSGAVSAVHDTPIMQAGVLEESAWIYLPPVEEQYYWSHNPGCLSGMFLQAGQTQDILSTAVTLYPGDAGYQIALYWTQSGVAHPIEKSANWVIAPGGWNQISMRMDPTTSLATMYLNGQQQLTTPYDPSRFQSIAGVNLWTLMGDGEPVNTPEPSSILAMLAGFGGMAGMIVRKKK